MKKEIFRKTLKITTAAILFMAIQSSGFSQGSAREKMAASTPEQRATVQTEFLKSKLDLSEEQTEKIQAVNLKHAKEMEPVLKGNSSKREMFQKAKEMADKRDKEYKAILDKDQYATYQKVKKEMMQKARERME